MKRGGCRGSNLMYFLGVTRKPFSYRYKNINVGLTKGFSYSSFSLTKGPQLFTYLTRTVTSGVGQRYTFLTTIFSQKLDGRSVSTNE